MKSYQSQLVETLLKSSLLATNTLRDKTVDSLELVEINHIETQLKSCLERIKKLNVARMDNVMVVMTKGDEIDEKVYHCPNYSTAIEMIEQLESEYSDRSFRIEEGDSIVSY